MVILLYIGAAVLGFFGIRTLKNASAYRFRQSRLTWSGIIYLGGALIAVVFTSWLALLAGAGVYAYMKYQYGNPENI